MQVVFWDVMPYDFDAGITANESYNILMKRIRPGSVIVLHDKPASTALEYLDRFLGKAIAEGYSFGLVDEYSRQD